jgi:hypothetical protein
VISCYEKNEPWNLAFTAWCVRASIELKEVSTRKVLRAKMNKLTLAKMN